MVWQSTIMIRVASRGPRSPRVVRQSCQPWSIHPISAGPTMSITAVVRQPGQPQRELAGRRAVPHRLQRRPGRGLVGLVDPRRCTAARHGHVAPCAARQP